MSGERKVIAIELREDEMVVILIAALTHSRPPEGATPVEALADVDPRLVAGCRDGVRALMEYWRDRISNEIGTKSLQSAGLGDGRTQ